MLALFLFFGFLYKHFLMLLNYKTLIYIKLHCFNFLLFRHSFFPSVLRLFVYFHFIYYRMGIGIQGRIFLVQNARESRICSCRE